MMRLLLIKQLMLLSPTDRLSSHFSQNSFCPICENGINGFTGLIAQSLSGKYSSTQNFYYTKDIEQIINQELSPNYIRFQQNNYLDDDEEYLKREYGTGQYPKKIQMLSEYYKFHRNQPVWNDKGVEPIMSKYYSRVKDVDYKNIKQILKKEQNISITTHKSFSSYEDSEFTKKSRYSTMLNQLNSEENESALLLDICDKIGKALKKVKPEQFKGIYYSGQKKFEDFLKRQKKRKETAKRKEDIRKNNFDFKKIKFNQNLKTKDDELAMKEIKFGSNHSLHPRNLLKYKQLSIEKTTANETISRQEKSRREKSLKNIQPKSSRGSLTKRGYRDNFLSELTPSYRQLGTVSIKSIAGNNLKTVNQIYQPVSSKQEQQEKKLSRASSTSRLKYRSNSSHNLQTNKNMIILPQNKLNQARPQARIERQLLRTNSKKKIPISTARTSSINLADPVSSTEKKLQGKQKQNSHRILRTHSQRKLSENTRQQNENALRREQSKKRMKRVRQGIQRGVQKTGSEAKQKSKMIQTMLQKKLQLFKKKQVMI